MFKSMITGWEQEMVLKSVRTIGLFIALGASCSQAAFAQTADPLKRWEVSINAAHVFVNEDISDITAGGGPVPGSAAKVGNLTTVTAELGYFVTPNVAINLLVGLPPTATFKGAGSLAPYGTLGKVDFGPVVLSAQYHVNSLGRIHPYVGAGIARVIFINAKDGSLADFALKDRWAPAIQAGLRYELTSSLRVNADVRYVPFSTRASGSLGGAPVGAKVEIDPILTSAGLAFRF